MEEDFPLSNYLQNTIFYVEKGFKIVIKNLNHLKRPISAVADNIEIRNAKIINVKTNHKIKFNLLYDRNQSLQKKIKLEQLRKET